MKRRIGLVLLAWIVVPWTAGTVLDLRRNRARAAEEGEGGGREGDDGAPEGAGEGGRDAGGETADGTAADGATAGGASTADADGADEAAVGEAKDDDEAEAGAKAEHTDQNEPDRDAPADAPPGDTARDQADPAGSEAGTRPAAGTAGS